MVEMGMRQEDMAETAEAGTGAQQLARRALAAVDQIALAAGADQQCRQAAPGRGRACGGAEEGEVEHR